MLVWMTWYMDNSEATIRDDDDDDDDDDIVSLSVLYAGWNE